jgi:hypothetical protein
MEKGDLIHSFLFLFLPGITYYCFSDIKVLIIPFPIFCKKE